MPKLSVIIPTRNRSRLLERALHSILFQTLSPEQFEVLVVDNGSTDNTPRTIEGAHESLSNLLHLHEPHPGLHNARHSGADHASGEILLFADDDIVAEPHWLEAMLRAFSNPEVGLATGRILPDYEVMPPPWVDELWKPTPWGRALYQYSVLDFGDAPQEIPPTFVFGCNFAIRASAYRRLDGFHPDSLPKALLRFRGDGETALAAGVVTLGYRVLYQPEATIRHHVSRERLTLDYLERRGYAQGISDSYVLTRRLGGPPSPLRTFPRRFVGALRAHLADPHGVRHRFNRGYWTGFRFHQREMRRDPQLIEWVLRPHYLDTREEPATP